MSEDNLILGPGGRVDPKAAKRIERSLLDAITVEGGPGNWVAPLHKCRDCGASLNWREYRDDGGGIQADCACGISYVRAFPARPVPGARVESKVEPLRPEGESERPHAYPSDSSRQGSGCHPKSGTTGASPETGGSTSHARPVPGGEGEVERVARAIYENAPGHSYRYDEDEPAPWGPSIPPIMRENFQRAARAVLAALRREASGAGGLAPEWRVELWAKSIRDAWVAWAEGQTDPKPSWLVPWEKCDKQTKDADRAIARHLLALYAAPLVGEAERAVVEAALRTLTPGQPGYYLEIDGKPLLREDGKARVFLYAEDAVAYFRSMIPGRGPIDVRLVPTSKQPPSLTGTILSTDSECR